MTRPSPEKCSGRRKPPRRAGTEGRGAFGCYRNWGRSPRSQGANPAAAKPPNRTLAQYGLHEGPQLRRPPPETISRAATEEDTGAPATNLSLAKAVMFPPPSYVPGPAAPWHAAGCRHLSHTAPTLGNCHVQSIGTAEWILVQTPWAGECRKPRRICCATLYGARMARTTCEDAGRKASLCNQSLT